MQKHFPTRQHLTMARVPGCGSNMFMGWHLELGKSGGLHYVEFQCQHCRDKRWGNELKAQKGEHATVEAVHGPRKHAPTCAVGDSEDSIYQSDKQLSGVLTAQ